MLELCKCGVLLFDSNSHALWHPLRIWGTAWSCIPRAAPKPTGMNGRWFWCYGKSPYNLGFLKKGGFLKWKYPQIIHFNGTFLYKTIHLLGYPHSRDIIIWLSSNLNCTPRLQALSIEHLAKASEIFVHGKFPKPNRYHATMVYPNSKSIGRQRLVPIFFYPTEPFHSKELPTSEVPQSWSRWFERNFEDQVSWGITEPVAGIANVLQQFFLRKLAALKKEDMSEDMKEEIMGSILFIAWHDIKLHYTTSHMIHHGSCIIHHMSYIIYHTSYVYIYIYIYIFISYIIYHISYIIYHISYTYMCI